jgi:hypothetical protein
VFRGQLNDNLISTNKEEQKLLTLFRKLNPSNSKKFLIDAEWVYTNTRKEEKAKIAVKLKKLAKSIKKITVRG